MAKVCNKFQMRGELEKIIETILNENNNQVNAYKSGKIS